MTGGPPYLAALFHSVSRVLAAERILKDGGISFKLIPVPKSISSDCGICVRFDPADRERLEAALSGRIEIESIVDL